ncbi:MAG TPA: phosphatidylglycerophosphatase A [Rhizomicrobium sp.]
MKIAALLSTLFGIGRAPAAGTVASLVALPFAWIILAHGGGVALGMASLIVLGIGIWSCGVYVRAMGREDPSECVIDELAGQWLACAFAPLSLWGFALAFIFFRLFDIAKPWPVSAMERLPGGYGVMMDDMLAGLIAGLLALLAVHLGLV